MKDGERKVGMKGGKGGIDEDGKDGMGGLREGGNKLVSGIFSYLYVEKHWLCNTCLQ